MAATTVDLIVSLIVNVASITEVCVLSASVSSGSAAIVTLELEEFDSMTRAMEFLMLTGVVETARLAESKAFERLVLIVWTRLVGLESTVTISTEEGDVATRAVVELRDVESILSRLSVEWIHAVVDSLASVHSIDSELLHSLVFKLSLESSHLCELNTQVLNMVDPRDINLAARALHKVEGNSLRGPSASQKGAYTVHVEDVTTAKLD